MQPEMVNEHSTVQPEMVNENEHSTVENEHTIGGLVEAQTSDMETGRVASTSSNSYELRIHRGSLAFRELCGFFQDSTLLDKKNYVTRILPNGQAEKAHKILVVFVGICSQNSGMNFIANVQ